MSDRTKKLSRRNFLIAAGAGGVATAAAVITTQQATKPAPASTDKRATRGYQASEHVNNYYRTTKV